MKASTRRMARGMFLQVRGRAKGMIGSLISNRMLRLRGRMEMTAGKLQRNVGRLQWVCGF